MSQKNKRSEPLNTSQDARYSAGGRALLGSLRGEISSAAEQNDLPDRFVVVAHAHRPAMIIHDTETGRQSVVGLYAYAAARKTLNDLFGPPKPTLQERLDELQLPHQFEFGSMTAVGAWSPLIEDCVCVTLELDGEDLGELGIGRIEVRDDGLFHLLTPDEHVDAFADLADALQRAEDDIVPGYSRLSRR